MFICITIIGNHKYDLVNSFIVENNWRLDKRNDLLNIFIVVGDDLGAGLVQHVPLHHRAHSPFILKHNSADVLVTHL